ncbi:uncharacterized protein Dyak_GE10399 [Drosophila yakuba]|uniref:Peptidase S1 domain-containing protein n=1 Tax=Drosophila yakuba TaxID=7245 RepID=A0A0R1E4J8_DROYA|nr:uncharacterized protein Dyak_GE10399 [Drosophila yakuba]
MAARLGHHSSRANQTKWFCGGTLISHHGIVNIVRLGELVFDTDEDDAEPQDMEVLEIKAHPNFQYPILYNDIGLVRLRKQVTFGPYKMPACHRLGSEEIRRVRSVQGAEGGGASKL